MRFELLSSLQKEKILSHSEKGPFVIQIVQVLLQDKQNPSVVAMAMKIFARLETCLATGTKHRLPSSIQKKIWSSFHVARFDETVTKAWDTHIMKLKLPEVLQCYTSVAFQIIFDRLMKALIKNKRKVYQPVRSQRRYQFWVTERRMLFIICQDLLQ